MAGTELSSHFIPALPTAKLAFLGASFIISPFLAVHCSVLDFVPVLRLPSSTLRPTVSSMFGIPIDAGSFPEVDFSGAEITVPRCDGDGYSSAVGTSLDYPIEFSALILYTQREPVIVASLKVFGTTSVSSPPNTLEHWSRQRHIPQPTPLH